MSRIQRKYDHEYKIQAVKLAREIGGAKAAKELGVLEGTIHTWLKAENEFLEEARAFFATSRQKSARTKE